MGIYCQRQRRTVTILMAFLLLAAVSALPLSPTPQPSVGGRKVREEVGPQEDGIISVPPTCIGRCGNCTPCKPVLVSVPPEMKRPLGYYPQKWKCKCGGKLYDP